MMTAAHSGVSGPSAASGVKLLVLLIPLVLLLGACGNLAGVTEAQGDLPLGDSSSETEPVPLAETDPTTPSAPASETLAYSDSILAQADTAQRAVSTGRFTLTGTVDTSVLIGSIVTTGEFNSSRDSKRMVIDETGLSSPLSTGTNQAAAGSELVPNRIILIIGPDTYVSGGSAALVSDNPDRWVHSVTDPDQSTTTGVAGTLLLFGDYRNKALTVTETGTAEYDGVLTTEYEVISDDATIPPLRVWIGDDGLIRHFETTVSSPDSLTGEDTEMTIEGDLFDYGEPITIEAPPPDLVVEAADLGN